jgi:hypothetical protein
MLPDWRREGKQEVTVEGGHNERGKRERNRCGHQVVLWGGCAVSSGSEPGWVRASWGAAVLRPYMTCPVDGGSKRIENADCFVKQLRCFREGLAAARVIRRRP